MDNIMLLTSFFAWSSVINIGIYTFSAICLMVFNKPIVNLHSKLFPLSAESLNASYFSYLSFYNIAIIVFNVVPYIALKLMV